eukprot:TRINITY_DN1347_c0_g2_i1.p1 TRINITY_DN1347_c0_g2~~TRINITY_DN1347_c0_g2_i1.p1  ORF type:complete len:158 (+),score=13.68 TRINITY_DN1347_c0_g2_i1:154-627(+)
MPITVISGSLSGVEGVCARMCECKENGYDNVRVVRGQMTIRCRGCEHVVKAAVETMKRWKCEEFQRSGQCPHEDACQKLHVYHKKRNVSERVAIHGEICVSKTSSFEASTASHNSSDELSSYGSASTASLPQTPRDKALRYAYDPYGTASSCVWVSY